MEAQIGLFWRSGIRCIKVGLSRCPVASFDRQLGARNEHLHVSGLQFKGPIEIGLGGIRLFQPPVDPAAQVRVLGIVGRQFAGTVQSNQSLVKFLPRRKGGAAPAEVGCSLSARARCGGFLGRCVHCGSAGLVIGGGQIEYRAAVVREIQLLLTVGHIDPV